MDGWVDDLVSAVLQHGQSQQADMELHLNGHVIEYDPKVHMCRCLLTTRRGEDENGEVQLMETGWIHVGTPIVGDGWGLQYCLKGGATKDNPEDGEEVQVSIQEREKGLCTIANLVFNDKMKPPGAGEDNSDSSSGGSSSSGSSGGSSSQDPSTDDDGKQQLQPAEFILKHESGSFIKFYKDGSARIVAQQTLYALVNEGDLKADIKKGNATVTLDEGDATINTKIKDIKLTADMGDINIEATKGAVKITSGKDIELTAGGEIIGTEHNGAGI